jgi:biopolymer transport protein ExbB/TolQ
MEWSLIILVIVAVFMAGETIYFFKQMRMIQNEQIQVLYKILRKLPGPPDVLE